MLYLPKAANDTLLDKTDFMTADLALIGGGYWGKNLARNFLQLGALHTLCDANAATLDSYDASYSGVAKVTSFDQVLNTAAITKIAIATPAATHYQLATQALLAGKHVYVEKPLCLSIDQGDKLIELAKLRQLTLMVGHLLQYHPCVTRLRELVRTGQLGKLYYVTSNRLNLGKIRSEENALWSFAPHDISVILGLSGQLPESVQCTGEHYLTQGIADTTLTQLAFSGGMRAHVYVSWLNPFKEQKLTVIGSSGMAVFDDTKPWAEKLIVYRDYLTWESGQVPVAKKSTGQAELIPESEPLKAECQHFLDCCQTGQTPLTDGREGLAVLQVLDAAQRSLEAKGQAVQLTQPNRSHQPGNVGQTSQSSQPYFAHETAIIDQGAQIADGCAIWHFSHVCSGAQVGPRCNLGQNVFIAGGVKLGSNVKVQNNVSIYAGTEVGDDVFLGPSCVLTNVSNPRSQVNRRSFYEKTVLGRGATVGANATIVCGVELGRYAFIAAGATVTTDVPDYALMMGVPAKQKGWMSRHGHPLRFNSEGLASCPESGLRYQLSAAGTVRCLDLAEDAPLPPELAQGRADYESFKE